MTTGRTAPTAAGGLGRWRELVARYGFPEPVGVPVSDPPAPDPLLEPRPSVVPDRRAPMGSADLVYGSDGRVAWGEIWEDFCDLALDGGPPHRGEMLPGSGLVEAALADPEGAARVREELARGMSQTTSWPVVLDVDPGWIGLRCPDPTAATWMANAILHENVDACVDGELLLVPAGPTFTLKGENKNVVTSVAKTWHYWARHGMR